MTHVRVIPTIACLALLFIPFHFERAPTPIATAPCEAMDPMPELFVAPPPEPPPDKIVVVEVPVPVLVPSEPTPLPTPRPVHKTKKTPETKEAKKVTPPTAYNCDTVRWYSAHYSRAFLESMAKARGISDADMAAARRCLVD